MPERTANAAVQGMRAPAAAGFGMGRQVICHIPAGGNDPMEAPDL